MFRNFSWWRLYFWGAITGFAVSLPNLGTTVNWAISTWLLIATEIFALIGLYAFAFKRKVFSNKFWRAFFWTILIIWNLPIIYSLSPLKYQFPLPEFLSNYLVVDTEFLTIPALVILAVGLVLSIPILYALYKVGYAKKH